MSILEGITLLAGVALFLFGMTQMGDGLTKVSGSKLEPILFQLSGTPLRALLLGTGVTAVIQSSSATSVMAVGFVNSGMMSVRQAINVILGAILGTSMQYSFHKHPDGCHGDCRDYPAQVLQECAEEAHR